jgi:hypothetical protein
MFMKQFKSFLLVLVVLATTLSFQSCDKDDKNENLPAVSSIVGSWDGESTDDLIWEFKKDGTGVETTEEGTANFHYTYVAETNKLKFWYVNSDAVLNYDVALTGDILMLSSGDLTIVFKRM